MNQPQQAAPQQTDATPTPAPTFEQRFAALHEELGLSQPAGEESAAPQAEEPPTPAEASPAVSATDEDTRRAERQARLEALKAKERERVDARARKGQAERIAAELERERQRATELEQRQKELVDISNLDEASFFDAARRAKVDPAKLGEWIRDSLTNPEKVASQAATRALDPKFSAVEEKLAKQEQIIRELIEERQSERAAAQEHALTNQWLGFVSSNSESAPIAARFLERHGATEFMKIATQAGSQLPEGAGPAALLDAVESFLDSDGRAYAQQLAELYGLVEPAPSKGKSPTPKSAAAKAKTVSNAIAQERASLMAEDDLAKLPFEERLARLKAAM